MCKFPKATSGLKSNKLKSDKLENCVEQLCKYSMFVDLGNNWNQGVKAVESVWLSLPYSKKIWLS